MGAIVGERQRIDDAAAREGDARLALQEGNVLGPSHTQRMGSDRQAASKEARHVLGRHRPEADAATVGLDLDQRLEPEQAARARAHDLDRQALALGLVDDRGRDLVGADGAGRGVARHEDARGHHPTSRAMSSIEAGVRRPIGSPSSMADGPEAQRPRQ